MATTVPVPQARRSLNLSWATTLGLLTALVAAGTSTLHLIGDVRHQQFLQHWGIDAGLFPKAVDWTLINGYYGVVDRLVAILSIVFANLHWLAVGAVICGLYVFILLSPQGGQETAPAWIQRLPAWCRRLLRQTAITAVFVSVLPCAMLLLTAFMVIPAALGESAGKTAAQSYEREFRKGCDKAKIPCVSLRRQGEVFATGLVLDSAPSNIALFDVDLQQSRYLSLDQVEILTRRSSSSAGVAMA